MAKRRNVLIGVGGIVAIAGCSDASEPVPESDNEPEEEEEIQEEESEEEEEIQEEESEEEEELELEEEEEESEEEDEPTDAELLDDAIERAEEQYQLGLDTYAQQIDHDNPTILHFLPSHPIDYDDDAIDYFNEAGDILWDEARDYAQTEEEEDMVREYRTYDDLIRSMRVIHRDIHRSYTAISSVEGHTSYSRDELDSAIERQEDLEEDIEDNEMYMEILTDRFEQLSWMTELMEDMYNGLENVSGARDFALIAPSALNLAREDFSSVVEELEDTESAPPEDYTDEDMLELAEEYYEAVDEALREVTQNSDN